MVKHLSYAAQPQEWLAHIKKERGGKDYSLLEDAVNLHNDPAVLEKGVGIAEILLTLKLDNESLAAAILYPLLQNQGAELETVADKFSESTKKLLNDALQMQSLGSFRHLHQRGHQQIENLRKLLLAMVTDVRAVLIILAERLWLLRKAKPLPIAEQHILAEETMHVYAPLANRLGVWHLKWELEDLSLRYLKPETYTTIAKWLATRRQEREDYIERMIVILNKLLNDAQIKNFEIFGRVKHIYSIYKKMLRKNTTLDEIYDISALRVLIPEISDCYNVLSLIQNTWPQVLKEFDDYISQPKPNGYRSIHIVIIGPENRHNEIQIRTYQMHQESELGVAAHWLYKEGVLQASSYEAKIALLRQVMAWQKEVGGEEELSSPEEQQVDLLSDRVYVFTPLGDIIDLPKGATPLDFAYHIHSEIGHRCRGAKVNNVMVTLTQPLQTGERVEIITAKEANPSRDWLNPQLGYLKSSRARATVAHWYRLRDGLQSISSERETLKEVSKPPSTSASFISVRKSEKQPSEIQILGVSNLLTKIAGCCKPLPGDLISGYITQARGITIHRRDCNNIAYAHTHHPQRIVEVSWGDKASGSYPVDLQLIVYDRSGLIRDITTLLAGEKINLIGLQTTQTGINVQEAIIYLTVEISNVNQLKRSIELLKKIPNIMDVRRK